MIKKIYKKIPPVAFPLIICVVLLCVLVFLINFRIHAASTGGLIGEGTGTLVGRALGSLEGLTVGQIEGFNAGKEKGLSAEDTTAELSGKIKEVERLQVLVASGIYTDIHKEGDEKEPDFAVIFSQKYNAVFTINLATANIELKPDGLHIVLDQPESEFLPVGKHRVLDEYQKGKNTGSSADGYTAAINSINKLKEQGTKALADYEAMMNTACVSAEKQLKSLVDSISLSKPEVIIEWRAK